MDILYTYEYIIYSLTYCSALWDFMSPLDVVLHALGIATKLQNSPDRADRLHGTCISTEWAFKQSCLAAVVIIMMT